MAKVKAKDRPPARRPAQTRQETARTRSSIRRVVWPAVLVVVALGAFLIARQQAREPGKVVEPPPAGLPNTPDYHSLLVDQASPDRVLLGTHVGLYESKDGGQSWAQAALPGQDAMNLVRSADATVWAAGHDVLAKSVDDGETWEDVRPEGLPSLDVHGFAADPSDPSRLYAAVAGEGLFGSVDDGGSFEPISRDVGGGVLGLSVAPNGRIFAADPERGLLVSDDGGRTWRVALPESVVGVAVKTGDPETVVATGQGIFLSRDSGETWRPVLSLEKGAGPVAWAPSDPSIGYAVGFDRRLYRTSDGGASWRAVEEGR